MRLELNNVPLSLPTDYCKYKKKFYSSYKKYKKIYLILRGGGVIKQMHTPVTEKPPALRSRGNEKSR